MELSAEPLTLHGLSLDEGFGEILLQPAKLDNLRDVEPPDRDEGMVADGDPMIRHLVIAIAPLSPSAELHLPEVSLARCDFTERGRRPYGSFVAGGRVILANCTIIVAGRDAGIAVLPHRVGP